MQKKHKDKGGKQLSIKRRELLLSGAAATFFLPAETAHAEPPENQPVNLEEFELNILHQPENFYGQVDQEVILLIDTSSSMDAAEVQTAITGVLRAIREHNFLTNNDSRCPGSLGLGFIKFQTSSTPLGYAILASNDDVEQLEAKAASFNLNTGGSTGIGDGLEMTNTMQSKTTEMLSSAPQQRIVIVIGDEPNNIGPRPEHATEEIATNHGATVHGIAMNQASDYEDVITVYKPSHERNGQWVDEGQIIEARTAEEIQNAILTIINPHCFMSHNLERNQIQTIDHA